jgi:hypothetical protein
LIPLYHVIRRFVRAGGAKGGREKAKLIFRGNKWRELLSISGPAASRLPREFISASFDT